MSNDDEDFLQLDPETAWLETKTIGGFRVWHIIAICLGILFSLVIMVCCCIRFRIPRTKQEIEADYQRKQITKKFREKLQQIKNSDMDDMDLQKEADPSFQANDYIYYSDKTSILPHVQHLAWEDRKQSIVSLGIVEAGCVALRQVTHEIILHRSGGILKQMGFEHHIVHPTSTYRYNRGSQFMIRNPMIHKKPICNHSYGPRYHYIRDQYEDSDSEAPILYTNRKDNTSNNLESEHPTYGCNL